MGSLAERKHRKPVVRSLIVFGRLEASSAANGVCFAVGYLLFPAFVVGQRLPATLRRAMHCRSRGLVCECKSQHQPVFGSFSTAISVVVLQSGNLSRPHPGWRHAFLREWSRRCATIQKVCESFTRNIRPYCFAMAAPGRARGSWLPVLATASQVVKQARRPEVSVAVRKAAMSIRGLPIAYSCGR